MTTTDEQVTLSAIDDTDAKLLNKVLIGQAALLELLERKSLTSPKPIQVRHAHVTGATSCTCGWGPGGVNASIITEKIKFHVRMNSAPGDTVQWVGQARERTHIIRELRRRARWHIESETPGDVALNEMANWLDTGARLDSENFGDPVAEIRREEKAKFINLLRESAKYGWGHLTHAELADELEMELDGR